MSTAIDKAEAALGAWQHEVEKLATTMFECFEREEATPTQTGRNAYAFAVHEVSSALRPCCSSSQRSCRRPQGCKGILMFTTLIQTLKEKFMSEPEKKLTPVERYKQNRAEMEEKFETTYKTRPDPKEFKSPSGHYLLRLTTYETKKGCWDYSRGEVFDGEKKIADVKRNYGDFPFAWAEGHPNGHSYLLCGESYQGYTTIELDTGRRNDLLPESYTKKYTYKDKAGGEQTGEVAVHPNGYGFCWAGIHPSPDRKVIAVSGCYWACPYEVMLYDFSEPMKFPYWELERWDGAEDDFESWETEGKLLLSRTVDVRKSDGKPYDSLTDEETDALKEEDIEEKKITKLWEPTSLPAARSAVAQKEYERLLREMLKLPAGAEDAYDVLADLMDEPGRAMTEEARQAMAQLSADLQKTAAPGTWGARS